MLERRAALVKARDARRAPHVVDRALVPPRMDGRARIGPAAAGPVARSARDAVVARQLLVPKERFAEHTLALGRRVFRGLRHGRQPARASDAEREAESEADANGPQHAGILPFARSRAAARMDSRVPGR